MSDRNARVEGSHRRAQDRGSVALYKDSRWLRVGEPGGHASQHAARKLRQRLARLHQAEVDIGLEAERAQRLIEQFAMLAGRDEQRTHLAGTTQLGEHRRELNALGARTDDEGEGGHLV